MDANSKNILCVDMEDWYHPEYVKQKLVTQRISLIHQSVSLTLNFLRKFNLKATFFIVGELVETYPELVQEIIKDDHEIAFHGYYHEPLWQLNSEQFLIQLKKYVSLIKSITGHKCLGFRAPSFSLDNKSKWAIAVLENEGFAYDSSIFPIKTPLYGEYSAPIVPYHPSSSDVTKTDPSKKLIEFPPLMYPIAGLRIPVAGGFYLRTLPLFIQKKAIAKMNKKGFPAVFTFHTWELDPDTPRLKLGLAKSFVTYHNVPVTQKLEKLLSSFCFTSFENYISENHNLLYR